MIITKRNEKILRKEFSLLKNKFKNQDKEILIFMKRNCKNLFFELNQYRDYKIYDMMYDIKYTTINLLLKNFRSVRVL